MNLFNPTFSHSGSGCIDHLRALDRDVLDGMIRAALVLPFIGEEYNDRVKVTLRDEGFGDDLKLYYIWEYQPGK